MGGFSPGADQSRSDDHGFTLADDAAATGFRGGVTIEPERHRARGRRAAPVYRMVVAPRFAKQGIDRSVLVTAFEMSRSNTGIEPLNLTAIADNERAIHVYHSL